MPYAPFLQPLRGEASSSDDLINGSPLQIIARPLYAPRYNQPKLQIAHWQVPVCRAAAPTNGNVVTFDATADFETVVDDQVDEWSNHSFRVLLSQKPAFVIGNHALISEFGIPASWLRDQKRREEARELIAERDWWKTLGALRYKENDEKALIGLKDVSDYHRTLPPLKNRKNEDAEGGYDEKNQRLQSVLRLRKAIQRDASSFARAIFVAAL